MFKSLTLVTLISVCLSATVFANALTLSSQDITDGELMSKSQEFTGFGCTGGDLSPQLQWKNIPEGTKSFAITAYDPDAPTGSGWWHWQIINIPLSVTDLATGAGNTKTDLAPTGSMQINNDYGSRGFGGACPPVGHGVHHYQFTVHALSVDNIELPADASGALAGYMINANTIATSTIVALYERH
ncbi:YbhB/YbcL family Raf kinase inhibitor-like protein [Colwellia sp. E2M01]|uniref:YbhB/YbcL family Raf kinase inhibitor-like protein n=1 Tax=Colwellia sp. E2M01 TaxID=2841561 RepID=UPI001C0A45C5|nr:YbhB/YbcL family Raf kinase inhibitor-like protein [Colwellia sp. E2M01]MBU2871868.1 YbhB/YbcL family Raf kinase inhibitor-like protein [Colwellia sp. E2M01]